MCIFVKRRQLSGALCLQCTHVLLTPHLIIKYAEESNKKQLRLRSYRVPAIIIASIPLVRLMNMCYSSCAQNIACAGDTTVNGLLPYVPKHALDLKKVQQGHEFKLF
jgi:hypothetical protein